MKTQPKNPVVIVLAYIVAAVVIVANVLWFVFKMPEMVFDGVIKRLFRADHIGAIKDDDLRQYFKGLGAGGQRYFNENPDMLMLFCQYKKDLDVFYDLYDSWCVENNFDANKTPEDLLLADITERQRLSLLEFKNAVDGIDNKYERLSVLKSGGFFA